MTFAALRLRSAPPSFPPPKGSRFVGAREGLRLFVRRNERRTWTYYVIGPGDVLMDFNGYGVEDVAERYGIESLVRLAQRVLT